MESDIERLKEFAEKLYGNPEPFSGKMVGRIHVSSGVSMEEATEHSRHFEIDMKTNYGDEFKWWEKAYYKARFWIRKATKQDLVAGGWK